MKVDREDLKEFTVDARIFGPTRSVSYVTGDTLVNESALIIRGISQADAWQILAALDDGLFASDDPVVEEEQEKQAAEAVAANVAAAEPVKKKRKRRTKAEMEAAKAEKLAAEEKAAQEAVGAVEEKKEEKEETNGSNGYDLEQFKSATGLSSVVSDLVEAGVESADDAVKVCLDLQKKGIPCLKGVNIERRVPNIWARVAS